MSDPVGSPSSSAKPQPVPPADPAQRRGRPSDADSESRATSTARLASPVPSSSHVGSPPPPIRQIPISRQSGQADESVETPLPGAEDSTSLPGPGQSALAAAIQSSLGRSPPRFGTPPIRPLSPAAAGAAMRDSQPQSAYGSFDMRSVSGPAPIEDHQIVKRHLVLPTDSPSGNDASDDGVGPSKPAAGGLRSRSPYGGDGANYGTNGDEFSSLQLQGGDVTRQVYRWTEDAEAQSRGKSQRSRSFHALRPDPESDVLDINNIKVPGGFRRNYLRRAAASPSPPDLGTPPNDQARAATGQPASNPRLLTNSFIEFLTLYGHFAGEELEEDDEVLGPNEYFSSDVTTTGDDGDEEDRDFGEESGLLTPGRRKRKRKDRGGSGENTVWGAVLLLLKSFVGTGVLFLPKAFLNGGMLFSNLVLLFVALLSYYSFILLVNTRLVINGSFGDIGGVLYGKHMRAVILFSIVISQIGFAAAYIVFTSQNLQAFILAVSDCRTFIDIKYMILMQLVIFLPLSLVRDISKLGATALVADFLILLGLIYLYWYDIFTIVKQGGVADIINFNPRDWTLFIGTAIFTFEGVGLIIPIQESMKRPQKFPAVLGGVMVVITIIFVSMGALSYAAYGSKTKTVVILNLPQDDKFVNAIQFFYSVAILLSTPLQLFPAIRITETSLFSRSGKYNPYIKWQKNVFRFVLVMLCALLAWGGAGDLDKFVALVGSFACVPLVYVYPPLLHFRGVARTRFQKTADVALCVFGIVVMFYTTTLTIKNWASGGGAKTPGYCDE
ncbi:MAG: neutral amino acid transporter [Thelocarpon impressellum]|nr:MAG: neutral amino acid transporter [Thelocarpon impressellum]